MDTGAPGSPGPLAMQSVGDNRLEGETVMTLSLKMAEKTVLEKNMKRGSVTEANSVQVKQKYCIQYNIRHRSQVKLYPWLLYLSFKLLITLKEMIWIKCQSDVQDN